ncbi:MAG: sorbosone dehydrogenase [Flammeovirgaceae bacterium]|nr:sorbosone dehydrogenase [Flammeovirgaceae bacterium]HCX22047.1 sorbosone dehydrogenase [Cytophagales bacterium]|tara:strand:- start:5853 stop:7043 length:1191 start_codon:yes stop_codon:yes gene_type:complete
MKHIFLLLLGVWMVVTSCDQPTSQQTETSEMNTWSASIETEGLQDMTGIELDQLTLPDGFKIDLYARVKNARSMALSPSGTVYVGNRRGGNEVYAIKDTDGDFKADVRYVLDTGMRMPNGVAFHDGDLYVAEVSKLWRYENIEEDFEKVSKTLIYDDYPTDAHHGWKFIDFGPDGKLYVPVGAPCNICESKDSIYASITRMNPDGTGREVFAHGVRNTVGFTWHPETGDMYFTDNGRDALGDTIPPCELNRATEAGQHFGYPYCHGGYIADPEFGDKYPCEDFVQPAQKLGPHVAPLGIKFYNGNMFPEEFNMLAFIAEHGSWNRSQEAGHTGHKITTVKIEDGQGVAYEDFITGFLNKETNIAWGRPVAILFLEDGSMLISDDLKGAIYRVTYEG